MSVEELTSEPVVYSIDNYIKTGMLAFQEQEVGIPSLSLTLQQTEGNYLAEKVTITHTYEKAFSSTTSIENFWLRLGPTYGIDASNLDVDVSPWYDPDTTKTNFVINDEGNGIIVTITTNLLHLIVDPNGFTIDDWFPVSPEDLKTAYSLHLHDPEYNALNEINALGSLNIFPNPSEDNISVVFDLLDGKGISFQLIDITGKVIIAKDLNQSMKDQIVVDISQFQTGIYVFQLLTDKGIISQKIIKE